ncbi:hypothetical protein M3Y94_00245300 [Aphelenchoides besseyi]|nr:hypothetical protein M3Y94_00245300 [Aphelenchoides besseyi]KAI6236307.1 hypothetical protein M3Y95_00143500 [Aphelenchoides besseyi]
MAERDLPKSVVDLNERIAQLNGVLQRKQEELEAARERLDKSFALHNTIKAANSDFNEFVTLLLQDSELTHEVETKPDDSEDLLRVPGPEIFSADSSEARESELFSAFQHGDIQKVRVLIETEGATNSLNLQELCFYFGGLREPELIAKCQKCLKLIINVVEKEAQ